MSFQKRPTNQIHTNSMSSLLPSTALLQGDFYGHVLGIELLEAFKVSYGERLLTLQMANVEGIEDTFKGFNSQIRSAVKGSIRPLMQIRAFH